MTPFSVCTVCQGLGFRVQGFKRFVVLGFKWTVASEVQGFKVVWGVRFDVARERGRESERERQRESWGCII